MYTLWTNSTSYVVQSASSEVALHIDRSSGEYSAVDASSVTRSGAAKQPVGAFLGLLPLRLTKYAVFARTAKYKGSILSNEVFALSDYELLPLRDGTTRQDEVDKEYLALVAAHLAAATLYWSPTYDLTTALQRHLEPEPRYPFESADPRFFWNSAIANDLVVASHKNKLLGEFVHVTIYGMFHLEKTLYGGEPIEFGVISRRSRFRAGTRYFRRGIDDNGNVANFNETEQILVAKGTAYSYLQTRGSVPAKWGEVNCMKYKPKLRVGGAAVDASAKHFAEQKAFYGPNYLVNLVNQSGYEKPVKDVYEQVVAALNDKDLHYVYFDFHHEASKMRWHRVYILIDKLIELGLDSQKWFSKDLSTGKILSRQTSVVRTNCMDCLDRTNVVQSTLGSWTLQQQLEIAGVLGSGQKWESDSTFVELFRNIWADNADAVSCAYSGTGALKTDFTRTGKRTKLGALQDGRNSLVRFYLNNLSDGPRQDGFNIFLGDYSPHESVRSPFIDRRSLWIQSVPYILGGSAFVFLLSVLYPSPNHSRLFDLLVSLLFLSLSVGSYFFIIQNGMQYVNWPKLLPVDFVQWQHGKEGWRVVDTTVTTSKLD